MIEFVGCLGKLPFHAEFIRDDAVAPEVTAFDQLIQEGLFSAKSKLGAAIDARFLNGRNLSFCWKAGKSNRALLGVAKPSRDSVGRLFPFMVFAGFSAADSPEGILAHGAQFLAQAERITGRQFDSIDAVRSAVGELRNTVMSQPCSASATSLMQWATLESGDGARARDLVVLKNIEAVADTIRGTKDARIDYGLGFPLWPEAASALAYGLALVSRALPGLGMPSAVYWVPAPDTYAVLMFQKPSPSVPIFMMCSADVSADVFRLDNGSDADAERARAALPPRLMRALDKPGASLAEIISAY